MSFDGPDSTPSDSTDISVAVDITDQPLKWDGNDARILGLLKETWEHLERNGHLVTHIQKRARVLSNGKLAVDHISSVPFLMGLEDEPERTLTSMCPPAPLRIASVNAWRATPAGGGRPALAAVTAMPTGATDSVIVQPLALQADDGKLMTVLLHVFGHAEPSKQLFREARGNPFALVTALVARGGAASTADTAVVLAEFDAVRTAGISGELTLEKVSDYSTRYERAKIGLHPSARPTPAAEVELVNLMAFRDASVREAYALRTTTPPSTFSDAIQILKTILTARLRAEQLDEAMSGKASEMGLVAPKAAPAQAPAAPAAPAEPPADAMDKAVQSALASVLKKMGVKDPQKFLKEGGKKTPRTKKKSKVPRDATGRIIRWVEGMDLCKCGIDGGKHLFRDCPKREDTEKEGEATETAASSDLLASLGKLNKEDLLAQVTALLGGNDKLQGVCELNCACKPFGGSQCPTCVSDETESDDSEAGSDN